MGAKLSASNLQTCLLLSTKATKGTGSGTRWRISNHAAAAAGAGGGRRIPELAWEVAGTGHEHARAKAFFLSCSCFEAAHLFRVTNGEE